MPGIPLLNLGYGLGGLVQGYQNQQSQGLQQALQRLQLQQAQSQSNAQTLAGLALQAGLLNNPAQTNPLQQIANPMPQTAAPAVPQSPAGGSTGATPPPPAVPVGTTYPPPPPAPNVGFGDINLPQLSDPRYLTGMPTPAESRSSDTTGLPSGGQTDEPAVAAPPPPKPGSSSAAPQQSDTNGDTSSAPSRSDSSSAPSPGGGGGGVAAVFPNGQSIDISSMFKTIDYQKLAQGIAQLAPRGTSQADIYAAVLDLGKLAEGDKVQQQQAGLIARTLLGGQFKLAGIGEQQAGAMSRTQVQQAGATGRTELQQAGAGQRTAAQQAGQTERTQMQIDARKDIADQTLQLRREAQNIRNANDQARIAQSAQRIAISAQNAGRADIALQIQSISRRISTIKPQADGSYTDVQQQQLKAFSDQIAALAAQAAQGTSEQAP